MYKGVAIILALICIGAVCTVEEFQQFVTEGSDIVLSSQSTVDYALIIDRSGSMREGNRFAEATGAAEQFVEQLRSLDRAAIIGFDRQARVYSSLTSNKQDAYRAINRMTIGDFTQYNEGLGAATQIFASDEQNTQRIAILLSDGKPDDDPAKLDNSVEQLLAEDACIFTIAYAEAADEQAQAILRDIARRSQETLGCGQYFRADENSYDLTRVYNEIFDLTTDAEVLEVRSQVSEGANPILQIDIRSAYTGANMNTLACFNPITEVVLLRDNQVLSEQTITSNEVPLSLPAGEYSYVIRATETCGGDCAYTGQEEGSFTIGLDQAACAVAADELANLVASQEEKLIRITGDGFNPRTVGTEGVVTWRNVDTVNHQVQGLVGDFQSPVLRPGEEWSYAFAPGEYTFIDTQTALTGTVRREQSEGVQQADIILVLDRSGSMAGAPLDNAKKAASTLLGILDAGDRSSLIVFSDTATTVQSLTSDTQQLNDAVISVRSQGSTSYTSALEDVGEQLRLSQGQREKLVIFLSDGAPDETDKEVIDALNKNIGDACLYTIGYGEQGTQAIGLLSRMADIVQDKNECGLFYYSQATEEQLAQVFGEVYALSTKQQLRFENLSVETRLNGDVEISTRIRTQTGRELPFAKGNLCLPPADVEVAIGDNRFPLRYDGSEYVGVFNVASGEYSAVLTARVIPLDQPEKTIVGSTILNVDVDSWSILVYGLLAGCLLFYVIVKVLKQRRNPPKYAY